MAIRVLLIEQDPRGPLQDLLVDLGDDIDVVMQSTIGENSEKFDVIVIRELDESEKSTFGQTAKRILMSGTGLLCIHDACLHYSGIDSNLLDILGIRSCMSGIVSEPDGTRRVFVSLADREDPLQKVTIEVSEEHKKHPIISGVVDFEVADEIWAINTASDVDVLLTATIGDRLIVPDGFPENVPVFGCRSHGNSRSCFLLLGHYDDTFYNGQLALVIVNTINWLAKDKKASKTLLPEQRTFERVAVICGIEDYQFLGNLPSCLNDSKAMYKLITGSGDFDKVFLVPDVLSSTNTLEVLRKVLRDIGSVHELLFYYSGHGGYEGDEFYFTFKDTEPDNLANTAVSNSDLDKLFRELQPELIVKIIDACHSGVRYVKGPKRTIEAYLKDSQERFRKCIFLYSSEPHQPSYAGDNLSRFTEALFSAVASYKQNELKYINLFEPLAESFLNSLDQRPIFVMQASGNEIFLSSASKVRSIAESALQNRGISSSSDSIDLDDFLRALTSDDRESRRFITEDLLAQVRVLKQEYERSDIPSISCNSEDNVELILNHHERTSISVASRLLLIAQFGSEAHMSTAQRCLRALSELPQLSESRNSDRRSLDYIPALISFYAFGFGAVLCGRYGLLKQWLMTNVIDLYEDDQQALILLNPFRVFSWRLLDFLPFREHYKGVQRSCILSAVLDKITATSTISEREFSEAFDLFECLYALSKYELRDSENHVYLYFSGKFAYTNYREEPKLFESLRKQLMNSGKDHPVLSSGFFNSSTETMLDVMDQYWSYAEDELWKS